MTWSDFYLLCFLVGFSLSVLSFLAGAVHIHLPFKMHLPFHGAHHAGASASHGGLKGRTHNFLVNPSLAVGFPAWVGGNRHPPSPPSHPPGAIRPFVGALAGLRG